MDPRTWLKKKFSEYYEKARLELPPRFWEREFGVGDEKKIDYRHLSFKDSRELISYLKMRTPLYISYSSAYYQFPSATPMEAKGYLGSDLIFDFDLGDIKDISSKLISPEDLELVKKEVIKLIENFLVPDFGLDKNEILVFFSGSKGYHVHIRNDLVYDMDQRSRMEIVDYVTGNMNPGFFLKKIGKSIHGPRPDQGGWHGKLAKRVLNLLETEDLDGLVRRLGVSRSICQKIYSRRDLVSNGIINGNWDQAPVSGSTWTAILASVANELGVKLDRNVTIDISRLIRLPTSLHGDTGLLVTRVKNLDKFSPLDDAIVFGKKSEKVLVKEEQDFYLGGEQKIERGEQELPEFLAVYLVARGEAVPIV